MKVFSLELNCNNGKVFAFSRFPVQGLSGCSGKDAYTFSVFETAALKYSGTDRLNFSLLDSYF